jgi:hypothetical protein
VPRIERKYQNVSELCSIGTPAHLGISPYVSCSCESLILVRLYASQEEEKKEQEEKIEGQEETL